MIDTELKSEIACHYAEEHRHYHTMQHIDEMFTMAKSLENTKSIPKVLDSQWLAILFHDSVYNPTMVDNEEESCDLMRKIMVPSKSVDVAGIIIMDTKHHSISIEESKLVVDLDLLMLSKPYADFSKDTDNIRKEYSHLRDKAWNYGRKGFLEDIQEREFIYHTPILRDLFEVPARDNIRRAWGELNGF